MSLAIEMRKIDFVYHEYHQAIYVEGKLLVQGESIAIDELLRCLEIEVTTYRLVEPDLVSKIQLPFSFENISKKFTLVVE